MPFQADAALGEELRARAPAARPAPGELRLRSRRRRPPSVRRMRRAGRRGRRGDRGCSPGSRP
eukprot:12078290-Alexandrium_andersonii.AAC.1